MRENRQLRKNFDPKERKEQEVGKNCISSFIVAMFAVCYSGNQINFSREGGLEFLHRSPAGRRRRR
jgi:hypothetical protein